MRIAQGDYVYLCNQKINMSLDCTLLLVCLLIISQLLACPDRPEFAIWTPA